MSFSGSPNNPGSGSGGTSVLGGDLSGTTSAAVIQALGLTKYLRPSGGDDSSQLVAAINAGYSSVWLAPGTFLWTTSVPLVNRNSPLLIRGSGLKATIVQLSVGAPRFLDPNKVADYDTFTDIELRDFTLDDNSVGGSNSALFGTYRVGTNMSRINIKGFRVDNVDIVNLPAPLAGGANPEGLVLQTAQAVGDTQVATILDVDIRRFRVFGGRQGISLGANATGNASFITFIDRIRFEDCLHDTGLVPVGAPVGSWANFQIGLNARGGADITMRNCVGKGSNDVGIETDGLQRCVLENVDIYDAFNTAFLHSPFQTPTYPDAMEMVYRNCRAINTGVFPDLGSFGVEFVGSNTGHVIYDNCWAIMEGITNVPATIWPFMFGQNATQMPCLGVTFRNCKVSINNCTITSAGQTNAYFVSLSPAAIGGVPPTVSFEGTNSVLVNWTQGGAGTLAYRGMCLNSGTCIFTGDGAITFDITGTGQPNAANNLYYIGLTASTVKGKLPRLIVKQFSGGDTTPTAIRVSGTGLLTITNELMIEGCDFTALPVGAAETNTSVTNSAKIRLRLNKYIVFPKIGQAQSATTFTTAAFVSGTWNQYIGPWDALIQFANGAGVGVTAIDISPNNGTNIYNVWTQASGALSQTVQFPLQPGWYVRVTFATTAPACTVLPQS